MGYCNSWCATQEDKIYHDNEWGRPLHNDRKQFEFLMLEVMQCGLSWQLMIKKRKIFHKCFDRFDFTRIAKYTAKDVQRILNTPGMIRSERKVKAIIQNAKAFLEVRKEFGTFCAFLWNYTDGKTILYKGHATGRVPTANGLSTLISQDLRKRGFTFLGPVTVYSHLQACGIINDHSEDCPLFNKINRENPTVQKPRDHEVF